MVHALPNMFRFEAVRFSPQCVVATLFALQGRSLLKEYPPIPILIAVNNSTVGPINVVIELSPSIVPDCGDCLTFEVLT